ncbi:MAG: integrase [Crocinitomicaceae bacterium]|nr:integrase [Crocinitomicaceae bacterium]
MKDFLEYLKFEKRYSEHTITSYSNDLLKFHNYLEDYYEGVIFHSIKSLHLRSYMVFLLEKKMAKSTVARKISAVKSLFKFLLKQQIVDSSPVNLIETPKLDKKLPSFLKEDEIINLINVIEFEDSFFGLRDKLLITLFYQTGVRLSEIIELKEDDVRMDDIKVLGKRNKERIIPLSGKVKNLITEYRKIKHLEFPNIKYFFIGDKGNKMYEKFVYRKVNYYLSMVSSKQKRSPHILRHTFATHMLNNGADLNAIKEILGHENLSATQVYTHNSFEKLKSIHKQSHPRG